jgi:hypothetical protein
VGVEPGTMQYGQMLDRKVENKIEIDIEHLGKIEMLERRRKIEIEKM